MIRFVVITILLAGCRMSLEDTGDDGSTTRQCTVSTTSAPCMEATMQNPPTMTWIEQKIFTASCNFSGCHSSISDAGKLDLRAGMSHDHLVGVSSMIDPTRKLVVPNDVESSYLMLMLRDVPPIMANPPASPPPGGIGYMPQGAPTLCCQKLDALERWITAGAQNN